VPGYSDLDFDALGAVGLVDGLAAERLLRFAEAIKVRSLAALDRAAQAETGTERGMTESEVMAAIRWPIGTVKNSLAEAGEIARRLPETLAALQAARVSWPQARVLARMTNCLSDEHARAVQERILPRMPHQGYVSTQRAIRTAVIAVDPDGAARRHAVVRERRRVVLSKEDDGMATLSLYTTAQVARGILNAVDARCRKKLPGDTRTLDQRRADTLGSLGMAGAVGCRAGR
jgi:hypothetical protein